MGNHYYRFIKYFFCAIMLIVHSSLFAQNDKHAYHDNQRVNTVTNITEAIYNINSDKYEGTPEEIAHKYLNTNKTKFGIKDTSDLKLLQIIKSPAGNHVSFIQTYRGIPVYGSETVVSIDNDNRVEMIINGNVLTDDLKSTTASIDKDYAINSAVAKVGLENNKFIIKPKAELNIYQDSLEQLSLIWKVNFIVGKPHGDWQIFVDANTGQILKVKNLAVQYVSGQGRVFKPDPITALQNTSLRDQNNSDYSALQSAYATVTLSNLNDAVNGVYRLQGMYARSEDIEEPNTATVTNTTPTFSYNRSQAGFEETNAYYFIDLQRQYIGSLGFSPQWSGNDYIRFDAHGYSGADNSWYNPDGPYIAYGDGGIDDAEDQDMIIHEYIHALHDALMTGTGCGDLFDELAISEGAGDFMAISYRRTLSSFQSNKIFPWDGNGELWPGRSLNSSYVYSSTNWSGDDPHDPAGVLWASTMMDIQNSTSRDIATTLLLASFSYVSPSSTVTDHVNAILQADRSIYNGSHLTALANVFIQRGFFTNNTVSGTISSSTTWSGFKYVTGNVTVNSSVTVTVSSGTFVFFGNGSILTINGTLTANGSSSSPSLFNFMSVNSSTQNGIIFNSGSSGTINYCQIRNAYRGIYENNVTVNITNSAISGCTTGLYLNSSSPTIQACNIHNNYDGIYLASNSSPYLYNNYIQNNTNSGVNCYTSSNPKFGNGNTQGNNNITGNAYGVVCQGTSLPMIGRNSTLDGGYNNLVNTTYNVLNTTGNTVYAQYNWWGTTDPNNFKISNGNVSYSPYLSAAVSIPSSPLSKANGNIAASGSNDIPMLSELDKAYQFIEANNLAEAKNVCLNLVNNYPDYSVSFNALNLLKDIYLTNNIDSIKNVDSVKNIYRALFNNKDKKKLYAVAGLLLADVDKENKLQHIDDVINNYSKDSVIEMALAEKFIYYYFDRNDKQNALAVSKQLDNSFPLSLGAIGAHQILGDMAYYNADLYKSQARQNTVAQTPSEFGLSDNYPNPFNPTTQIEYQLPKDGFVSLKVYDILGREVRTLVSGYRSAGKYSVNFDASKLASGIYIYQLRVNSGGANNFVSTKKMQLIK